MRRLLKGIDQRLGTAKVTRALLNKVFPDHWSFLLGEVALYSFLILVGTGIYLTLFFDPSQEEVLYSGSYIPLQGIEMSRAYASALDISFSVRSGLIIRQVHHWAALVFVAAIVFHLLRTFFTGAFRKPRELNWVIGITLLILAYVNGFTGYSMIDDQLSGTGLRIGYSIVLSIPLVGPWLSSLLLGGEFPGADIISRLFVFHILIVPVLIGVLIALHMAILVRQKHTQFPGRRRREDNVVGYRLWPVYAVKAVSVFFLTAAVLAALGGLVQINPIWLFGPFRPADVSSASQPDWYLGWLEGALRLMPAWELRAPPFEIPNPFYPALLLAGLTFGVLYAWPWLEARFTGDREVHHLLDRPSERPVRTSIGVAGLTFYGLLFIAGSDDVLAVWLDVSVNAVVRLLQAATIILPILAFFITRGVINRKLRRRAEGKEPPPRTGHSRWEARIAFVLGLLLIWATISAFSDERLTEPPERWTAASVTGLTGAELYAEACAQCHGVDLEGNYGPALGPGSDAEQMSDVLLGAVVFSGIGDMRPMTGVLTQDQVKKIVAYIRDVQAG